MAHDWVICRDAVTTEYRAHRGDNSDCLTNVVEFANRYLVVTQCAQIFEFADVMREQNALFEFEEAISELSLRDLRRRERLAEQDALF